jgi:hypothetical protein
MQPTAVDGAPVFNNLVKSLDMQQLNYMLDKCRATHRARVGVIYVKINLRNRAYTTCILLNVPGKMAVSVSLFLGAFEKLRRATINFAMSVRPSARNNSAPIGQILMKFDIWVFFENLSRKFQFH